MKPRHGYRLTTRQQANADLCGLPLTEYLALSRCARRARLGAAKKGAIRA